jgi:hypothetical protein
MHGVWGGVHGREGGRMKLDQSNQYHRKRVKTVLINKDKHCLAHQGQCMIEIDGVRVGNSKPDWIAQNTAMWLDNVLMKGEIEIVVKNYTDVE